MREEYDDDEVSVDAGEEVFDFNITEQLIDAAGRGSLAEVKRCLDEINIDEVSRISGDNAVVTAVKHYQWNVLEYLRSEGADLDVCCSSGTTVLAYIVMSMDAHSRIDLIRDLYGAGVDFWLKDDSGESVLLHAANTGNVELVQYLVEEVRMHDDDHHSALRSSRGEALRYLRDRLDHNNNDLDKYLFLEAVRRDDINSVRYLVEEKGVNVNSVEGQDALLKAGKNGAVDVLKYFIEDKHMSLDAVDRDGENVLFQAAYSHSVGAIAYLHDDRGMDLNVHNRFGQNILYAACKDEYDNRNQEFIRYLYDNMGDQALNESGLRDEKVVSIRTMLGLDRDYAAEEQDALNRELRDTMQLFEERALLNNDQNNVQNDDQYVPLVGIE